MNSLKNVHSLYDLLPCTSYNTNYSTVDGKHCFTKFNLIHGDRCPNIILHEINNTILASDIKACKSASNTVLQKYSVCQSHLTHRVVTNVGRRGTQMYDGSSQGTCCSERVDMRHDVMATSSLLRCGQVIVNVLHVCFHLLHLLRAYV